jgi:hypothetical protein
MYLMPLEWNERKVLHPITVFQNLNTPLIKRIDAIHHMSITYLSTWKSFFVSRGHYYKQNKFRKAELMTVQKIMILANTCVPVRLNTACNQRHMPITAGIKSVTTVGNPDYPDLFSQPGLVVPNHHGDITFLLQNCGNVNM